MTELISDGPDEPTAILAHVLGALGPILEWKRAEVAWKLDSIRAAYVQYVEPQLNETREGRRL
jgi:hypothetical protein